MLGFLRRFVAPKRTKPTRAEFARMFRARYDAAQTTPENRRHWANADGLSADAANSPVVRKILRDRARYEVANSPSMKGIVRTLAADVIGTGPRLQVRGLPREQAGLIEREWSLWAKAVGLPVLLRTGRLARAVDGESFALLSSNPLLVTPVKLSIRGVEADRVTTPDLFMPDKNAIDGIRFDDYGNPIAYHVLRSHPGDPLQRDGHKYDSVAARYVLHWFQPERHEQHRGVSEIMAALPIGAYLRRLTLATLGAAELAALLAAWVQTDAPPNEDDEEVPKPFDTVELERAMMTVVPAGWKAEQWRAEQPTAQYESFHDSNVGQMGRCLEMTRNIATGNSKDYNYASGRMDHQSYFLSVEIDRELFEVPNLDKLLTAWIAEANLIPGYVPYVANLADLQHEWVWDGREHVDPVKESNAQETRLRTNCTTLAAEYARAGRDWETELRQRAREQQLIRELGLEQELSPSQSSQQQQQEANT